MKDTLIELEKQYISALLDYLTGGGETALERAYELGRQAIADGRSMLDIAAIHQEALTTILLRTQEREDTINKACQFFIESIAPFEMAFRGFRESITKLQSLNRTLEQSEMKFRSVVEAANDAIISCDNNGNIASWNRRAQTLFGYSKEEILGKPLTLLIPEQYGDVPSKTFESHGLKKDGSKFPIEISSATWKTEEGSFFIGIIRDITERKKNEEKILEQAALLDKAQDAIGIRDLEHRIIYLNKSAQRLYGWTLEEAIGKNADELLYREKSSHLVEAKRDVIEKGEWLGELRQRTKDNKDIIVEGRWTLVHDNDGKPKSILIINTDITEKKMFEAHLLRAQRMESIGTLAGGIAHDFNNVLTPIMLSLQILRGKLTDEQSQKLLAILERNSQRGADLIKQVLSFARGVEGERKPLEIAHIISEIEIIAKETFPRNIKIRTNIKKGLYAISGDATQLHQVMMNLCVNARDAMSEGGILGISVENCFIDKNYAGMHTEAKVGNYVAVEVSDTGKGIPPEIIDRIFEPFFTTKEQGKGTGLGLSTVLAIVKSHDGFINVHSEVGKGATFAIYLPAIKTEMRNIEEMQTELPIGHGELVLVAEDESSVREIVVSTLEEYEYSVLAVEDGAQAVAEYAQNSDKIKVVLIDMMMPVMDGRMSIQAIRKINPEVKIIAVSGLAEKDKLEKIADYADAFLPKPYTAENLLRTINKVINAK